MVVDAYLTSRRAAGASAKHIDNLTYRLGFLTRALPYLPSAPEPVEDLLASLTTRTTPRGHAPSAATHHAVWRSMRALFRWAALRYDVRDPMASIPQPKKGNHPPSYLTRDQLEHALRANAHSPRNVALLHLLAMTGARLGEISGLTWNDITVGADGPTLRIPRGKTGGRSVPLDDRTMTALRRGCPNHNLWTGRKGTLTHDGLRLTVRVALARAGIAGGPHLLRHTFATLYVQNGGNIFTLMSLAGWRNIQSVTGYVHLDLRDARRDHARYAPLADAQGGTP
jgi:integrase